MSPTLSRASAKTCICRPSALGCGRAGPGCVGPPGSDCSHRCKSSDTSTRERRCLHRSRGTHTPRPHPAVNRIALGRCYNSSIMDETRGRSSEPVEAAGGAEGAAETVEELRKQLEDKQDKLLRALAEADNFKRRTQRERDESIRYANESLLRDLIPVLDNFDRALGAARAAGGAEGVVGGIELIQRELLKVLERAGVTRYSALGQPFDPTRHEAIARLISADAKPGTVVAETMPGYLLHNRVLRAALVSVAAAPDGNDCVRWRAATTRCAPSRAPPARPRSRRPIASSRCSTIPTATAATRTLRNGSKKSTRRTPSCPIRTSAPTSTGSAPPALAWAPASGTPDSAPSSRTSSRTSSPAAGAGAGPGPRAAKIFSTS